MYVAGPRANVYGSVHGTQDVDLSQWGQAIWGYPFVLRHLRFDFVFRSVVLLTILGISGPFSKPGNLPGMVELSNSSRARDVSENVATCSIRSAYSVLSLPTTVTAASAREMLARWRLAASKTIFGVNLSVISTRRIAGRV